MYPRPSSFKNAFTSNLYKWVNEMFMPVLMLFFCVDDAGFFGDVCHCLQCCVNGLAKLLFIHVRYRAL